ncbi:HAD family phosphatase [Massilia sp. TS11]|uniref:HAD family hydrolase n=1 Tax=Massilia sp. TS11 TaxID=2908003 RepID=UPI001EDBF819|nr:HAD family phosphatase [Massilia sp. TS11]MCG2584589.1 HAD family phosphatase [Massilia sp. TS11]
MSRRAFIFDMDGTIVDNMAFHTRSWLDFLARHGCQVEAEAFFRDTAGRQAQEIMRSYLGAMDDATSTRLAQEKEAVYRDIYAPHLRAVDGFDALVAQAQSARIALAVASAAPQENIRFTLDGLDIRRHFDAVVCANDVARGKPEPDAFLLAAERCGIAPADCIVFEDAPLGVEAARRAGMRAVALTTTLPASAFDAYDNVIRIARDFTELEFGDLLAA